jgi:hypothetical protein
MVNVNCPVKLIVCAFDVGTLFVGKEVCLKYNSQF